LVQKKETCKWGDFDLYKIPFLNEEHLMAKLYSACDLAIVPSKQETLSNTIMEALSCSLPVVAFDIGGNSDMIEHKVNGYLASPFDVKDLASGVIFVLNNANYEDMRRKAREKILRCFDSKIIIKKYIEFYNEILRQTI
jgi:glycosyltransferase involved in cell wall biosynthesis